MRPGVLVVDLEHDAQTRPELAGRGSVLGIHGVRAGLEAGSVPGAAPY
jgi:hypothetical protein